MSAAGEAEAAAAPSAFGRRVMGGIVWRSGSQIVAQLATWAATFLVIRLLRPADYGLYAMTASVLALFGMLSGASFASALVRAPEVSRADIRRVFGLLLLLNGTLALIQFLLAPLVAAYYRQPLVTELLRVQTLLYAANPLIALSTAMLSRQMDFAKQAMAHFASAIAGAGTALLGASLGWGVWTLVFAPIALFWTRAIGVTIAARPDLRPSFDLRGARETIAYGLAMVASQLLWFVQTQADVFIGGRRLDPHALGLYTTALFLAQILTAKFIPPMNEVAFSAYARLQGDRPAVAAAFARSVRMIMLVAMPFYVGMGVTARPLVETVLGSQWSEAVPVVRVLACAMPFTTLQILFPPVTNALGRPRLGVLAAGAGAVVMPLCFAFGVAGGPRGLAIAWLMGMPLVTLVTIALSIRTIGVSVRALIGAVAPAALAAGGMAAAVLLADDLLPPMDMLRRLVALVAAGGLVYGALVLAVARPALADMLGLVMRRR